jgi:hypothetical protein
MASLTHRSFLAQGMEVKATVFDPKILCSESSQSLHVYIDKLVSAHTSVGLVSLSL